MAITIGRLKCELCEKKGGLLHSVHGYGIYGDEGKRHYFHPECAMMIEKEPEKFGHIKVDKVLKLRQLEGECKRKVNNRLESDLEKMAERCRQNIFERMLPGK